MVWAKSVVTSKPAGEFADGEMDRGNCARQCLERGDEGRAFPSHLPHEDKGANVIMQFVRSWALWFRLFDPAVLFDLGASFLVLIHAAKELVMPSQIGETKEI